MAARGLEEQDQPWLHHEFEVSLGHETLFYFFAFLLCFLKTVWEVGTGDP